MPVQMDDDLIFERPASEREAISEIALRLMPASIQMNVPLKVDIKQGRNWGEMQ